MSDFLAWMVPQVFWFWFEFLKLALTPLGIIALVVKLLLYPKSGFGKVDWAILFVIYFGAFITNIPKINNEVTITLGLCGLLYNLDRVLNGWNRRHRERGAIEIQKQLEESQLRLMASLPPIQQEDYAELHDYFKRPAFGRWTAIDENAPFGTTCLVKNSGAGIPYVNQLKRNDKFVTHYIPIPE